MSATRRATARDIAYRQLEAGDSLGWFDELYSQAGGDASIIPWADLIPNPNLVGWLDRNQVVGTGRKALKVGSGLGDDAEELAQRGFTTTAFDISVSAIAWSQRRFPQSTVSYGVADLFCAPAEFRGAFDFVLESYTLQVLPPDLRRDAMHSIASFVSPQGTLLIIARGRESSDPKGKMPWPLTKQELTTFQTFNLKEISFEDYLDDEDPPVRRFRVVYQRKS